MKKTIIAVVAAMSVSVVASATTTTAPAANTNPAATKNTTTTVTTSTAVTATTAPTAPTAPTATATAPAPAAAEFAGTISNLTTTAVSIKNAAGTEKTFNLGSLKSEGWKLGDKVTAKYSPATNNLVNVSK